jgi:hypothetical protein
LTPSTVSIFLIGYDIEPCNIRVKFLAIWGGRRAWPPLIKLWVLDIVGVQNLKLTVRDDDLSSVTYLLQRLLIGNDEGVIFRIVTLLEWRCLRNWCWQYDLDGRSSRRLPCPVDSSPRSCHSSTSGCSSSGSRPLRLFLHWFRLVCEDSVSIVTFSQYRHKLRK